MINGEIEERLKRSLNKHVDTCSYPRDTGYSVEN